ncbi:MAG TPA: hypothetical protein VHZ97_06170 [Pseudonocardiaceae bacterium]|nr:hypothetical protein [Pseudonocardiaceae bacterium]
MSHRVIALAAAICALFAAVGVVLWVFPGTSDAVNVAGDCLIVVGVVVVIVQLYRRRIGNGSDNQE